MVILRSSTRAQSHPGGSETTSGGDYVYTYNSSGDITF